MSATVESTYPPAHSAAQACGRLAYAVSAGAPIADLLSMLAEEARKTARCDLAVVALRGADEEELEVVAVAGSPPGELLGLRIPASRSLADAAIRSGQPTLIAPELHMNGSAPLGGRTGAVIPIVREGEAAGAIIVLSARNAPDAGVAPEPPDLAAIELISTMASLAATALRIDETERDRDRQTRELAVLYDAARSVSGTLNVQEVMDRLLDTVCTHFSHSVAALFLLNDERTHLFIAAGRGLSPEEREVQLGASDPAIARALQEGSPVLVEERDENDLLTLIGHAARVGDEQRPLAEDRPRSRSAVIAPVRGRTDNLGLLILTSAQPRAYSQSDVDLLSVVAAQSGIAIANAWLYEEATRRAEEAGALYDLSQRLDGTLNVDRLIGYVTDNVATTLGVDQAALLLWDAPTQRLRARLSKGSAGLAEYSARRGEGIPGWVFEWGTPSAVADVRADPRNAGAPLERVGAASALCVPLTAHGQETGVLLALSSRRRLFTVGEMELLYTIANQAASALHGAVEYRDARTRSTEMRRSFRRIASALGSAVEAHDVAQLLAVVLTEVLRADACALYSLSGESLRLRAWHRRMGGGARADAGPDQHLAVASGIAGWVARRGKPLQIEDLSGDERAVGAAWVTAARLSSCVAMPLRAEGQLTGVLEVYSQERRTYSGDEMKVLREFARRAGAMFRCGH